MVCFLEPEEDRGDVDRGGENMGRREGVLVMERAWANVMFSSQPCLHPQGWSDPQVRPQHLPSVLP